MCGRAQHQFVRAGPSVRAHYDDVALQAFGRPRDLLMWPANRHVERDVVDAKSIWRDSLLDQASERLASLVDECFLVVGDGGRCHEHGIFDEDYDQLSFAARGQQCGVAERLARVVGEIDGAENRFEESSVSHNWSLGLQSLRRLKRAMTRGKRMKMVECGCEIFMSAGNFPHESMARPARQCGRIDAG